MIILRSKQIVHNLMHNFLKTLKKKKLKFMFSIIYILSFFENLMSEYSWLIINTNKHSPPHGYYTFLVKKFAEIKMFIHVHGHR